MKNVFLVLAIAVSVVGSFVSRAEAQGVAGPSTAQYMSADQIAAFNKMFERKPKNLDLLTCRQAEKLYEEKCLEDDPEFEEIDG